MKACPPPLVLTISAESLRTTSAARRAAWGRAEAEALKAMGLPAMEERMVRCIARDGPQAGRARL